MLSSRYSVALVASWFLHMCSAQMFNTVYIVQNRTTEVPCQAGSGTKSVLWERQTISGLENVSTDITERVYVRRHLPSFSQTLIITSAQPRVPPANGGDFQASFRCTVTGETATDVTVSIHNLLEAVAPTSLTASSPPAIVVNETDGAAQSLFCNSDANALPMPVGAWRIYYEDGRFGMMMANELSLSVLRNETGVYECSVSNQAGSTVAPRNTSLTVNYAPDVTLTSPSLDPYGRIAEGSDLNLSCYANSRPYVTLVELIFINQSVNASVRQDEYVIFRDDSPVANRTVGLMRRVISLMRYAHTGIFVCRATNQLGYRNSSIQVTVVRPPSAPLNLTLVNHTHTHVTLDWHTPVANGGSPLTYYRVNCTASTGVMHNFSQVIDVNTTIRNITVEEANMQPNSSINATHRHTFDGLFGGEIYQCTLAAVNFAGIGDSSNSVAFNTTADAPCAPIVEIAAQAQNICVSWTLLCNGGSELTSCTLERDDGVTQMFAAGTELCEADGQLKTYCDTSESLMIGRQYTYSLRVMNSIGERAGTAAVTNTDPPITGTATVPMATEESTGLATGAVVGIIVAAAVAVLLVVVVTVIILKSDRKSMSTDKARVMADPSSEPTGLKFSNMNAGKNQTTYTTVDTVKSVSAPASASAGPSKTEYSDVDALKTKAYGNDYAMGSDTVV